MERPAGRLLSMLELLQNRPRLSGPELAAALAVEPRTVRRYVTTLQEMGIPVEAARGREGGYRLRPGFRLPPLMFSEDEAIGLTVALMVSRALGGSGVEATREPVDRALAKIERVLPAMLTERVTAIRDAVLVASPDYPTEERAPEPLVLASLCQGVITERRCWFRYRRGDGEDSAREVDPYGIVAIGGRWYLHAWCHMRKATRTFRVDRIRRVDLLTKTFTRPPDIDVQAAVAASLALSRPGWEAIFDVAAPLEEVRQFLPARFAIAEVLPNGTTRLRLTVEDLDWLAWRVVGLPWRVTVVSPAELRDAIRHLGDHAHAMAAREPSELPAVNDLRDRMPAAV